MGLDSDGERLRAAVGDDTFSDRYTVEREAGRGGMGIVYRAIERASSRPVAIKLLEDGVDHARFFVEAAVLERMSHPAIVAYVGHGVTSTGRPYLAMEWLDGESVAERLKRGPLSIEEAIAVGARVASALEHAHARDAVHRDLKPSNVILVGGDPAAAVLIDFGVAKDRSANTLTRTGQLVGTPAYMAPEQATGAQPLDGRADLFALGCLLYECLTGSPPFEGRGVIEVLARVLLAEPPRVASLRPEVPPRIDALIAALLAKDPAHRLADATVAATELAAIAKALGDRDEIALAEVPAYLSATAATVHDRPPRRRYRLLAASAAGVAVLAAAGIWLATRSPATPDLPCAGDAEPACRASCDAGVALTCRQLAEALPSDPRDLDTRKVAVAYLRRACELGEPHSCLLAGSKMWATRTYAPGAFTRADWEPLFQRGCDLDDPTACNTLAARLLRDPPRAPDRAMVLLEHACNLGHPIGCRDAAALLRGELADPARATRLLAAACARGVPQACQ